MVVNNTTVIEGKKALEILLRTEKRGTLSQLILGPLIIIAGIAVVIIGAVNSDTTNIIFGALFIAIGIAYLVYALITLLKAPKRIEAKNKDIIEHGVTYIYKFKEQSINVVIKEINKNNKADYSYDQMKKTVYEFEDRYQLMSKEGMIMVVDKQGFENPRMEDFFIKNLTKNKLKVVQK